jgi:hypothetical protein
MIPTAYLQLFQNERSNALPPVLRQWWADSCNGVVRVDPTAAPGELPGEWRDVGIVYGGDA